MSKKQVCPFLGSLDIDHNRGQYVEYPSFENRCWAVFGSDADNGDALMLSDQATFCLSESHTLCPRFMAAQVNAPAPEAAYAPFLHHDPSFVPLQSDTQAVDDLAFSSDWLNTDLEELKRELEGIDEEERGERRMWGWMGAAAIFLAVFAVGSLLALYAGWRYASKPSNIPPDSGIVQVLAAAQPGQPPVYIVLTATASPVPYTPPPTDTPTPGAVLVAPAPTRDASLPVAVTATPVPGNGEIIVIDPDKTLAPPPLPTQAPPTATPVFDFAQPVPVAPTRRPTPDFEIPTSTQLPAEPTPSPTATFGPPIVIFKPDEPALKKGLCTFVRWTVKNVSEVYYEGIGVNGTGEKEECIDSDGGLYTLIVVLPSGASEIYTTTVTVIEPTPTPTNTPTFTPEPVYTPTWTPAAPTGTPTPDLTFGADIGVEGSTTQPCPAGQSCEITLVATNLSNHDDNIAVITEQSGPWTGQLCRYDGVCANNTVVINNMGPYNNGYVTFRVQVPGDVAGQNAQYTFVAASGNSGNAVRSEPVTLTINAQ